jgi:lauroyl/myristoyl acyltransferase
MAAHVTVEGFEHVDEAVRRGDGLIGVTGHLGNYELIVASVLSRGLPPAWMYRPQNNWRIESILHASRQRYLGPNGLPRAVPAVLLVSSSIRTRSTGRCSWIFSATPLPVPPASRRWRWQLGPP